MAARRDQGGEGRRGERAHHEGRKREREIGREPKEGERRARRKKEECA